MVLIAAGGLLFAFGPYEPIEMAAPFDDKKLDEGVDVYLEATESNHSDIRDGVQKRVIWAGQREVRTPLSVVYLHGFSASSEEIRPVPDLIAAQLGANLVYTRFTGHGRSNDAMGQASVGDWMNDAAEALAIGRATGDEVLLIATSTGGTIAAVAATQPGLRGRVRGIIFISPNFGINNPAAPMLTLPGARHWLPLILGQRRSFEPRSAGQAQYWTTEYPSTAVFPMAALANYAGSLDCRGADMPALFYFSDQDRVVLAEKTRSVAARWPGPVELAVAPTGEGVDQNAHVVTGDILSPANTQHSVDLIVEWIRKH